MNKTGLVVTAGVAAVAVAIYAVWPTEETAPQSQSSAAMVEVTVPDTLPALAQIGQRGFEAKCADCHGLNAAGQAGVAPPLVHKIYEPSHHGDESFQLAAAQGVRAHHWRFGNMPPVEGVTRADVAAIIAYIRALQQANGIF